MVGSRRAITGMLPTCAHIIKKKWACCQVDMYFCGYSLLKALFLDDPSYIKKEFCFLLGARIVVTKYNTALNRCNTFSDRLLPGCSVIKAESEPGLQEDIVAAIAH